MRNRIASALVTVPLLAGLIVGAPAAASAATTPSPGPEDACLNRAAEYIEDTAQEDQVHYAACFGNIATISVPDGEGGAVVVASEQSASDPEERQPLDGQQQQPTMSRNASDMTGTCTIYGVYEVGCSWKIKYTKWNGTTPVWTRSISVNATLFLQTNSHQLKLKFNHDQGIEFFLTGNADVMNMQGWAPPTVDFAYNYTVYGPLGSANNTWYLGRANYDAAKFSMYYTTDEITDQAEAVTIPITGIVMTPRFQCPAVPVNDPDADGQCNYPNGEEAPVF